MFYKGKYAPVMKTKPVFLFLIIYTFFSNSLFSQNTHLKIKGKDSITNVYLKNTNYTSVFKNLNELSLEKTRIIEQIRNQGFFNNTSTLKKINDSTHILTLQLNKQFKKITISNLPKFINEIEFTKNTITHLNKITCPITDLEQNLNRVIQYLSDNGKTFSSLQLKNIHIEKENVYANLEIKESKENIISNIIIKGYEKFPKKFIKHYLKLKSKQILNTTIIEEKSKHLNSLPFSSELKKPQILFSKDSTIVFLYIKKQKSNNFDGFLGFASNAETNKLEINGNVNLKLINNLNTGEELHLKYLSTADEQKKLNLKTKLPYIFSSPFSIEAELDIFKKDSTFTTNQQYLQLKYPIYHNINIGTGIRFAKSTAPNNNLTTLQNFKTNEYTLNFEHIVTQQNNLFKTKNKTILELTTGKRKTETNNTPQQSIYLNSAHILNLNSKNSIYIKNESFYLITDEVLDNEMHFIGGINSIRGYQENSIPTYIYSHLNTEYRIQLNKTLYTHTVIDYGISKNPNKFDNLFGFGFGFGLKSKNNLLRFVFANNKTNSEKIKFSNSQIHLSLNTSF